VNHCHLDDNDNNNYVYRVPEGLTIPQAFALLNLTGMTAYFGMLGKYDVDCFR
jgi:hypothetical protein